MNSSARKELFSTMPVTSAQGSRSAASPAVKTRATIKVNPKKILNAVLFEMGLSEAKFKTYTCERGLAGATVYFWQSSEPTRVHGKPAASVEEAMQNAASKCLEHIAGGMEIELDCPQVNKMKVEMTRLSRNIADRDSQIRCLKAKLEKKDGQVRDLNRGWGSFAEDIYNSGTCIGKTAISYLPSGDTSGSSPVVSDVAWDFYGVSQEADNLTEISLMATDAVRTIGIYPYDAESDCSEFDNFPGYYPFDDTENNCGASWIDDEDFLFDEND